MAQKPSLVYAESLHTNPVNAERILWEPLGLARLVRGCFVFDPDYRGNALEQGDHGNEKLSAADRARIFEGNARRVFPRPPSL
jgi:hypothetical protein